MAYSTYSNTKRRNTNVRRTHDSYIEGNTVRKINVAEEIQKPIERRESREHAKRKQQKALRLNLGYMAFLVGALVVSAVIIMSYISLQSDIIIATRKVASLESELNNLKLSNDEDYARAASSVDLEQIRSIAIGELGMKYAKQGQIINVSGEGNDYVRQLAEIQQ